MSDPAGIDPIYFFMPGSYLTAGGAVFTAVSYEEDCGIILIRRDGRGTRRIPFTDRDRFGALLRKEIPLDAPEDYAYLFYRKDRVYTDPHAHVLVSANDPSLPDAALPDSSAPRPEIHPARGEGGDGLFYQLHVRGFTMTAGRDVPAKYRGTFEGVVHRIPYLKELGVCAVDLMPVYEPAAGLPGQNRKDRVNYWGYGEGFYEAPRRDYAAGDDPRASFSRMVSSLHDAGIRVFLQLHFPSGVPYLRRKSAILHYMTRYGVDGFHLTGDEIDMRPFLQDPLLAQAQFIHESMPQDVPYVRGSARTPSGTEEGMRFYSMRTDTKALVRRFVKGDAGLLREIIRRFIQAPAACSNVNYAADHDGFTLADCVTYSYKHNEVNGEENRDGPEENHSWNCGFEGPSGNREITRLRRRQIRNFLTLIFLMRGVPLLYAGDECLNSQGGNNNAYCQDNETGWTKITRSGAAGKMLGFTKKLSALRRDKGLLPAGGKLMPEKDEDGLLPALSLHGREAYCPDLSAESSTVGIAFRTDGCADSYAVYLALNMNWMRQELALPRLPNGWQWTVQIDTFSEQPFPEKPALLSEQKHTLVRERSIQILAAVRKETE